MSTYPAGPDDSESRGSSEEQATPQRAEPEEAAPGEPSPEPAPRLPESLTFRITPVALMVVLTIAVCVSPAAAALPSLTVLYVVPLGLSVWILRVRTTVHGRGLTVRTVTRTRELAWDDIRSLRLSERHWVRAVTPDGSQIRLPAVRVRDLPRLAAMSGGRVSDPDEEPEDDPDDTGTISG